MTSSLDVGSPPQRRNDAAGGVARSTVHSDPRVSAASTATVRFRSTDTLRPAQLPNPGGGGGVRSRVPTSTMRTYGPACVTVTPLATVDECARFPVDIGAAREPRDRSRALDAAALLRSEYEASFGGEVNPLVLYSTAGGATEQEVNLSKQTVYDNVQYFNM